MATLVKRPRRHASGQQDDFEGRWHHYINLSYSPASKLSRKFCNWRRLIEVALRTAWTSPWALMLTIRTEHSQVSSCQKKYFIERPCLRKSPHLPRIVMEQTSQNELCQSLMQCTWNYSGMDPELERFELLQFPICLQLFLKRNIRSADADRYFALHLSLRWVFFVQLVSACSIW